MFDLRSRAASFLSVVFFVVLCSLLFFFPLARYPFFNKGEPREALVVQSIVTQGEWWFPRKQGVEIPSKPPLFHWTGAIVSLIWGEVTDVTVRFPSALFATLGVLIVYVLGRKLFDPQVAFLGGLILATTQTYQSQAVTARVDMTLSLFVTAGLIVFYLIYLGRLAAPLWHYALYVLLGIGILAKGPVGLILPGMVICLFLGIRKRWDFLSRLFFHPGVVLTVALGIAWYGSALTTGGEEFFNRQIVHENLARFFSYGEGGAGHQKPMYYYIPYLFLEGLPWTIFLPFVFHRGIKERFYSDDGSLFLIIWVLVVFTFFSLAAGKRPVYLLPLYSPLALLIARWFRSARDGEESAMGLRWVGGFFLAVFVACAAVLSAMVFGRGFAWLSALLADLLKPKDLAGFLLAVEVLERQRWLSIWLFGLSSLLSLWLTLDLFRLKRRPIPLKLALLSVLMWVLAQGSILPAMAEAKSYRYFMHEVKRLTNNSKPYLYRGFDSAPVVFYYGSPLPPIKKEEPRALVERLRASGDYVIMSEEEWQRIRALDSGLPHPVLKSKGSGPDGDAPLVLIQGMNSPGGNP